ncbi:Myb/SANT-like domain containing protein [Parasponia andersonii]|uniref:Myb/SANT-like domain containing protein n=1 Tax=Parasponia andersonii TaxID=3476 RepID=A0A2P5CTT7_PARAD|nr:Myb/SANT-like domain containing protein [Parasponia andersonii]
MDCQTQLSFDRSRTHWTPAMENYFIDLMLDQVHRGNRMGHTFNKQSWNDMVMMFNANFGSPYDVNVLKSRYTNLWKQFNDIKNLLDQNGFYWDSRGQMVVAEKYVWEAYIKAHPDAQFYRNRTLVNFNDLCLIYAHTTADGRYCLSSHDIDFDDDIQPLNVGMSQHPFINLHEGYTSHWQ